MSDTVKIIVTALVAALLFGLVSGFSKACTTELLNNEPTVVYYTPNTQGVTND